MRRTIVLLVMAVVTALGGCTLAIPGWALGDDIDIEVRSTAAASDQPTKVSEDATIVNLRTDVLFSFGDAQLSGSARAAITRVVEDIPQGAPVQIVGHTDSIRSAADNKTLSTQRAQAVTDVVKSLRPDLVLEIVGKGESEPIAANTRNGQDDPQGRAKNRRVEVRYDE